ncbi:sensor histidine kinase [Massilia antarctica]|uniref:sensor histidine kinase n=1 Tax=Massilia antarctica TaxID=2765360 RepID=UPI0006BE0076|nr:histidine kinase [Massilia sp. H27-R4]MCY0913150.1 histidine kinase [Massilia sp. H27-R4]CUI07751.1 Two-component system sensor protein [Janthinobacterium sp. CG23_2]CUU31537.1 Two-component system sensor protein [Janthinobacterium sp. CG23_2]
MMTSRLDKLFPRAVWPLACLLVTGPGCALLWSYEIEFDALHSAGGRLASIVANHFTTPPSALSAGTDRKELTALLLRLLRTGCAIGLAALAWLRASGPAWPAALRSPAALGLELVLAVVGDMGLVYVFTAQLGTLPLRSALRWLAAAILFSSGATLLVTLDLPMSDAGFIMACMLAGGEAVIMAVVTAVVHVALGERRARVALAAAHAELQATQALLGEAVRASERMRLARDLHDMAGHHLTALKLHLDLAKRQAGDAAPASLATASSLAATLLADVRLLVSSERGGCDIDMRLALETLCAGIPAPRIELCIGERLGIDSAALAHALFCAVQEAISNAIRHAGAAVMTVALRRDGGGDLLLDIADDGRGSGGAAEGNGLRGMRERLAQLGGTLHATNGAGQGFALGIRLPATGAGA